MKQIMMSIFLLLMLASPVMASSSKLEVYNSAAEAGQPAALEWRLSVGKSTEDLVLLPNGNILVTAAGKQMAISPQGQLVWELKSSNGNMGGPVINSNGSIYAASASSIQETLPNGARGWSFTIYPAGKSGKSPWLAKGPEQILYLPLPDAIYAVDMQGHYVWSLYSWDTARTSISKSSKRKFMACAGDEQAFYVVFGEKADYRLAAVDRKGKFLWSYWLGDITQAGLVTDGQGRLYASVSYKKASASGKGKSKLLPGKIICFHNDSNKPVWTQSLKIEKTMSTPVLTAGILYVNANSEIKAFRASSGAYLWEDRLLELSTSVVVSPITGRIYAGSSGGRIYAVSPAGRLIWDRKLDGAIERTPLITADGTIYIITAKGSLYKMVDQFKSA